MARIRSVQGLHLTRVSIAGRLTASDLGRLERACSQALSTPPPLRIEFDMRRVTFVDAAAHAVLERMTQRGAVVKSRELAGR